MNSLDGEGQSSVPPWTSRPRCGVRIRSPDLEAFPTAPRRRVPVRQRRARRPGIRTRWRGWQSPRSASSSRRTRHARGSRWRGSSARSRKPRAEGRRVQYDTRSRPVAQPLGKEGCPLTGQVGHSVSPSADGPPSRRVPDRRAADRPVHDRGVEEEVAAGRSDAGIGELARLRTRAPCLQQIAVNARRRRNITVRPGVWQEDEPAPGSAFVNPSTRSRTSSVAARLGLFHERSTPPARPVTKSSVGDSSGTDAWTVVGLLTVEAPCRITL